MSAAISAQQRVGRVLEPLVKLLAYGGGLVLVALALMTVISIIGRAFIFAGLKPVRGDFELVELGCAIAIFAFLPWCQLNRGHVSVDILADALPRRVKAVLGLIGDIAVSVLAGVILWRLYLGFGEKFPYGSDGFRAAFGMGSKPFFPETTYELELLVWIPYGFALIGAAVFFVVALYTVWRAANWVRAGGEP